MKKTLPCLLAAFAVVTQFSQAEIIFDNSENFLAQYNGTKNESGDQVEFVGESRLINTFAFEYFGDFRSNGDETARVRFYLNDGPSGDDLLSKPGTLLYDSGSFTITSGFKQVEISQLSIFVPADTLIWTVEFAGLAETEKAGVLFYDPPQIGRSGNFLWEKENGQWLAVASANVTNNLAARFIATAELRIKTVKPEAGGASVTANSIRGKLYSLQFKGSVDASGWQDANSGSVRATGSQITLNDPDAAADRFRLYRVLERDLSISKNANQFTVVTYASPGKQYALEATTNMTDWTRLQTITATGSTGTFNTANTGPGQFFRVVEVEVDQI